MIIKDCFSSKWIQKQRVKYRLDPSMLEKCIYAFALLGHLQESGLPFLFKGGTSLLLHFDEIRRLSIDIDILSTAPSDELEQALTSISGETPFIGYEEDERGFRGLPIF